MRCLVAFLLVTACYAFKLPSTNVITRKEGANAVEMFVVTGLPSLILSSFFHLLPVNALQQSVDSHIQDVLLNKITNLHRLENQPEILRTLINRFEVPDLGTESIRTLIRTAITDVRCVPLLAALVIFVDKIRQTRQLKDIVDTQATEVKELNEKILAQQAELAQQRNYATVQDEVNRLSSELSNKCEELRELNQTITTLILNMSTSGLKVEEGLAMRSLRAENQKLQEDNVKLSRQLSLATSASKIEAERFVKVSEELVALRKGQQQQGSQVTSNTVSSNTTGSKSNDPLKRPHSGNINAASVATGTNTGTTSSSRVAMLRPPAVSGPAGAAVGDAGPLLKAYQLRRVPKKDLVAAAGALGGPLGVQELGELTKDTLISYLLDRNNKRAVD